MNGIYIVFTRLFDKIHTHYINKNQYIYCSLHSSSKKHIEYYDKPIRFDQNLKQETNLMKTNTKITWIYLYD